MIRAESSITGRRETSRLDCVFTLVNTGAAGECVAVSPTLESNISELAVRDGDGVAIHRFATGISNLKGGNRVRVACGGAADTKFAVISCHVNLSTGGLVARRRLKGDAVDFVGAAREEIDMTCAVQREIGIIQRRRGVGTADRNLCAMRKLNSIFAEGYCGVGVIHGGDAINCGAAGYGQCSFRRESDRARSRQSIEGNACGGIYQLIFAVCGNRHTKTTRQISEERSRSSLTFAEDNGERRISITIDNSNRNLTISFHQEFRAGICLAESGEIGNRRHLSPSGDIRLNRDSICCRGVYINLDRRDLIITNAERAAVAAARTCDSAPTKGSGSNSNGSGIGFGSIGSVGYSIDDS